MAKRRRRKTQRTTERSVEQAVPTTTATPPRNRMQRRPATRMDAAQVILMPAFVALGCWGLAVSFVFFFPDPNHLLYGGMAAVMGLIWSIIVVLRIRRVLQMNREGRIYS